MRRAIPLAIWAFVVWILLTWTFTLEQLLFGGAMAIATAIAIAPLGDVARPWALLRPRRIVAVVGLIVSSLGRILTANVKLARRIWTPSLPLPSGMVVVPTEARTDAALAGVGLITSLIVDNQIVDIDRERHLLQYHAVAVPAGDRRQVREVINGPVERGLEPLVRD